MFPKISLVSAISCQYPFPPLGLASIASYLIKKGVVGRKSIQIIDVDIEKNPISKIKKHKPDIVGISAMSLFYPQAIKLAREIKARYRKLPIVIGGVHISTAPQSFSDVFDLGVIGEGEETFHKLILHFKTHGTLKKTKLKNMPGLIFKENGRLVQTNPRKPITPLDVLPRPDWKLFSSFFPAYLNGRNLEGNEKPYRWGYITTSRGCPYRCVFCSTSAFWKKLRFHTPSYVADEVEYLVKEFNIERIVIIDDIFNFSKKRIKEIIIELDKKGLLGKVKFDASVRADYVDNEFCLLFKKMGGQSAFIGFESGSEKVLKFLKNNTVTVQENKKAALLLNKHKIGIKGGLIFGSSGESLADIKKTLQFMKWLSGLKYISRIDPYILKPFPGTKIWEIALEKGLISDNVKDLDRLDIISPKPFFSDKVDKESFAKIYKKAQRISQEINLSKFIRQRREK